MPGGHREGAGRKAKADKYRPHINKAEKQILDRLPFLIEQQLKLAEGVRLVDSSKAVKIVIKALQESMGDIDRFERVVASLREIFQTAPDRQAIEYLVNRVMGKPTERVDQETTVRGGITAVIITRSPDVSEPTENDDH